MILILEGSSRQSKRSILSEELHLISILEGNNSVCHGWVLSCWSAPPYTEFWQVSPEPMLLHPQLTIVDTVKCIPRNKASHVQRLVVGQDAKYFGPRI